MTLLRGMSSDSSHPAIGSIAKRISNDRLLFSIRGKDVYLELMGIRSYVYELAKRLERNRS